jgi:hypothetical protein
MLYRYMLSVLGFIVLLPYNTTNIAYPKHIDTLHCSFFLKTRKFLQKNKIKKCQYILDMLYIFQNTTAYFCKSDLEYPMVLWYVINTTVGWCGMD